ncbi:MAG: hypothetical protein DRP65_01785 [Planctomycetota bacterium]|nr:MAG: hypothetical protein DRP65_01785 [Planctomycetota bacterium]
MKQFEFEQRNISAIVKTGLCTGCGMCQITCPEQAIQMNLLNKGWFQAHIDKDLCTDCGLCLKVCARNPENGNAKWQELRKENEFGPFLGCFKNCYLGHSKDINIRWNATSGGLITSILLYCFEKGVIECVVLAGSSSEDALKSQAFVATSKEQVLQAIGSRYAPIPINVAIKKAMSLSNKIAIVALPCCLQSLRQAEKQLMDIKQKIVLKLGLFCSHNISSKATNFILRKYGIRPSEVLEFTYRGQGWPSGLRFKTKSGRIIYLPNTKSIWTDLFLSFVYSTPYCFCCTDQTNELADISFGDAWLSDILKNDRLGRSICIARSDLGLSILTKAFEEKAIHLLPISPEKVVESQGWPLYFKKINIQCRKHKYPENIVKISKVFSNHQLTLADYFISWYTQVCSKLSSRNLSIEYINYSLNKILLFLSKLSRRILIHRTKKTIYSYMNKGHDVIKPPHSISEKLLFPDEKEFKEYINILIVNQHGPNLGDESAFRGMLYGLKKMIPNARFTSLTALPSVDYYHIKGPKFIDMIYLVGRRRFLKFVYLTLGVLVYHWKLKFLKKLFQKKADFIKAFAQADLVISAPAGPYFGDLYTYGELSNAFNIFLSKLINLPVMIYAPSMGPFDNEKRNRWRKWLLSKVDVITLRDYYSKTYFENLGIKTNKATVTIDSCLQKPVDITLGEKILEDERIDRSKMLIGMTILDDVPSGNDVQKTNVKSLVISTVQKLLEIFDADLVLLPQLYGTFRDVHVLSEIAERSGCGARIYIITDKYNSDEQQSMIGHFDLFVSFRYHPFIFASRQAVPSVCVAYEHKAFGYAQAMGIEEYCLDLFSTTAEEIAGKAQYVWKHKGEFKKRVRNKISEIEKLSFKNSRLAADLLDSYMPIIKKL